MITLEGLLGRAQKGKIRKRPLLMLVAGGLLCLDTWLFFNIFYNKPENKEKISIEQMIAMHDYAGPEIDLSSIQKYKRNVTSENFVYECFKAEGLSEEAIKQFSELYKREIDKMNKELNISGMQSDREKAIAIARYVARNSPKVEEWYKEEGHRLSVWISGNKEKKRGNCASSSADLVARLCASGIKPNAYLIENHIFAGVDGIYIDFAQTFIHPKEQYPITEIPTKKFKKIRTCGPEAVVAAIYESQAADHEANNKFDKAIETLKISIATCPDYDMFYCHMGVLLAERQRYKEAETWFLKALRMNPLGALNHVRYGVFLRDRGLTEKGEEEIEFANRLAWEYDLVAQLCKELSQADKK